MAAYLFDNIQPHPSALDKDHAETLRADIDGIETLSPKAQDFLTWVISNSSYLLRLLRRNPDCLAALQNQSPEDYLDEVMTALAKSVTNITGKDDLMAALRHAKQKLALTIALCDLAGLWEVETVTLYLTRFADLACDLCLDVLLREAHIKGHLGAPVSADCSGIVILGMGKHGGYELNYSSDIDIIFFYTAGALQLKQGMDERKFYVQIVRDMVSCLQDMTADGYVFRVDLRLRPDPGATPVAISVDAAQHYYETFGQNWERAAFIKARPIAGDKTAGQAFLEHLIPYIWRRYLDFAAIDDVHSMKRQIHAVRGHAHIAVAGHNLKLGRGGIREIEFFVQTQQLIAGGQNKDLRGRQTVPMLFALAKAGWIKPETADGMARSYAYLRQLEHRAQMRLDEQTHSLPQDEKGLAEFANFAGYADAEEFSHALKAHLTYVSKEYAALFETAENLAAAEGNLVFVGSEDDPETVETLSQMGFKRPSDMIAIIRAWHTGRMQVMRSTRTREILTRIMPHLLQAFAATTDADQSLIRFDRFLSKLPAGIQLFSMFQAHPHILSMLVDVIGAAPRLANWLAQNPNTIDAMLATDFLDPLSDLANDAQQKFALYQQDDFQNRLDAIRLFVHEKQFRIGVRILAEPNDALTRGQAFADIADIAVAKIMPAALQDVAQAHGEVEEGEMLILGMGKFGGREMSMNSDLDMIMICDAPDFQSETKGTKPLDINMWYGRAARRIMSGLTAQTAEGALYEVDTRLRPSGNAGALVSKFASFIDYQHKDAWAWEHMALTRARFIAGSDTLRDKVATAITEIIGMKRDANSLYASVHEMRQRLRSHFPMQGRWDMKHGAGGLMDIEFIVQTLILLHAHQHPEIIKTHTGEGLQAFVKKEILSESDYQALYQAYQLFSNLRQVMSLCTDANPDEQDLPVAVENLVCTASNEASLAHLHERLSVARAMVDRLFCKYIPNLVDADK